MRILRILTRSLYTLGSLLIANVAAQYLLGGIKADSLASLRNFLTLGFLSNPTSQTIGGSIGLVLVAAGYVVSMYLDRLHPSPAANVPAGPPVVDPSAQMLSESHVVAAGTASEQLRAQSIDGERLADSMGIAHDQVEHLVPLIAEWINTPDWGASRVYLDAHAGALLTEESEAILAALRAQVSETSDISQTTIAVHQRLLHDARTRGINPAYDEFAVMRADSTRTYQLFDVGDGALKVGDIAEARQAYELSLSSARENGDLRAEGIALGRLGDIALRRGDLAEAEAYYSRSLGVSRAVGDRRSEGFELVKLGDLAVRQGDTAAARGMYHEVLTISRETGTRRLQSLALESLGDLATSQGDASEARQYFEEALAIHRALGDQQAEAEALTKLGREVTLSKDESKQTTTGAGGDVDERSRVRFSAYYPRIVPVETKRTLVVYVHMPDVQSRVRTEALVFKPLMGNVEPHEITTTATREISHGTYLTIVPECEGIKFNPPSIRLRWGGTQERAVFEFQADRRLQGLAVNGEIDIYVEMLNVATLTLPFIFDEEGTEIPEDQQETTAPLYERIFASYSHDDTPIVEACRRAYTALGMKVLIDTEDLRSGEVFTDALMDLINDANVFQLFWSERAAQSPFVREEWTHALNLNRGRGFIRPVRWEKPLTPAPPELAERKIHFKYIPLPSVDEAEAPPTREHHQSEPSATSAQAAEVIAPLPMETSPVSEVDAPSTATVAEQPPIVAAQNELRVPTDQVDQPPPATRKKRRWWW